MNLEALKILLEGSTTDGVDCHSAAIEYGNGSAVEVETGIFLYGFVRRLHPAVIVETGTHWGFSSAFIGLALVDAAKDYPRQLGHLFTVDSNGYDGKPERLWESIGVNHVITHHIGNSFEYIPPRNDADFLWLDADHAAEAIITEFEKFFAHCNPNGVWLAFHDTRLDVRMDPGIEAIKIHPLVKTRYSQVNHVKMRNFRGFDLLQMLP